MKKRILGILITLCMVISLVPMTAFAATQTAGSWSELQNLINSTNDLSVTLSSDISWGGKLIMNSGWLANYGTITVGIFNKSVTSSGTINDGIFNGAVDNSGVVTGGTFNGTTSGIYTVTFDYDAPSQIRANYPATAPTSPTKSGYIFNGWLNDGTQYDFTQNVTQNISLTADWTAKNYAVKFNTNGGTAIADTTLTWNDKVLDGVAEPIRYGYNFVGWKYNDNDVLTDTVYSDIAADDNVKSITAMLQQAKRSKRLTL